MLLQRLAGYVTALSTQSSKILVGGPCVVRGLHFNDTSGGTAGYVRLRDGGSGGEIRLDINTPGKGSGEDINIPGGGIQFSTNVYVELSSVDAATIFIKR